jgi:hypothetical protein
MLALFETNCTVDQIKDGRLPPPNSTTFPPSTPPPPSPLDDECTGACCSYLVERPDPDAHSAVSAERRKRAADPGSVLGGFVVDGEEVVTCTGVRASCQGPCVEIIYFVPLVPSTKKITAGEKSTGVCWWCVLLVVVLVLVLLASGRRAVCVCAAPPRIPRVRGCEEVPHPPTHTTSTVI